MYTKNPQFEHHQELKSTCQRAHLAGNVLERTVSGSWRNPIARVLGNIFLLTITLIATETACSQSILDSSLEGTFEAADGNSMPYRLWLPAGIDVPDAKFPLVVWLHGGDAYGDDNVSQVVPYMHGLVEATQSQRYASILLAPQTRSSLGDWATCRITGFQQVECPPGATVAMSTMLELIDELETQYPIDANTRVVLGNSAGGVGIFDVVIKHPDTFSTAVPISSGYDSDRITEPLSTRMWAFHGHDDTLLDPFYSRDAIQAILENGDLPLYTEPAGGHVDQFLYDILDDADDDLYPWLFEGVEPSLARLVYDPVDGNVQIDAESAPGGTITSFELKTGRYLGQRFDFGQPVSEEINGQPLDFDSKSLSYEAADNVGFGGRVDLGNILPPDMDFIELHRSLANLTYTSPGTENPRAFRLMTPSMDDGTAEPPTALQSGDADQDLDFDQFDLVRVQISSKYLTGHAATWGEGDWNGAPGGRSGNPPAGDGLFNQLDIIAAQQSALYLIGPYGAITPNGHTGDRQASVVYNPSTGELAIDAPANVELTSINIDSASGSFTGVAAQNLGGSFDNDADNNIFKATFGGSFGTVSFGNVAQTGLSEEYLLNDLSVVGSLAGGGDLGNVDLVYVPEPSSVLLLSVALAIGLVHFRRVSR